MRPALAMLAAVMYAAAVSNAHGAIVASYDMAGSPDTIGDNNDAAPVANLTVSNITDGPSGDMIEGNNQFNGYNGYPGGDGQVWWTRASLTVSPASSDDYVQFSLTVAPGYSLTIDSLTAVMGVAKNTISGDVAYDLNVYASQNGFATPGTFLGDLSHTGGLPTTLTTATTNQTKSLTSLGTFAGTLTFRLFVEDLSGSSSTSKYLIIDTISVDGEVSAINGIPAPAALPAGLALLGLVTLRRRRVN